MLHRKCPGNPSETHAMSERVAPRATVAWYLRSERDVVFIIIKQTNFRATISRVAVGSNRCLRGNATSMKSSYDTRKLWRHRFKPRFNPHAETRLK